jgi:hypothetical protein
MRKKGPATKAAEASELPACDRNSKMPPAVVAAAMATRDSGSKADGHRLVSSGCFCPEPASEGGITPRKSSGIVVTLLSPDTSPPWRIEQPQHQ